MSAPVSQTSAILTPRWTRALNGVLPRCGVRLLLLVALGLLAAGCARGKGQLEVIDLDFRRLDVNRPMIDRVEPIEAVYWEADGKLYVAFGYDRGTRARGLSQHRLDAALVLDGPPAENAREYQLDSQSLRLVHHDGPMHQRYRALRGIARVHRGRRGLDVQFRIVTLSEFFHILTGWNIVGETLVLGTLQAAPNKTRGEAILEQLGKEDFGPGAGETPSAPAGIPRPVRIR